MFTAEFSLPKAPYLIAIASELAPRAAPASLLIERSDIDNFRVADHEAELTRLRMSEAAAREMLADARASEAALRAAEEAAREAAEAEARAVLEQAREDARKALEHAQADTQAIAATLAHTRAALVQANNELERVGGSARRFLWQYIPRLWRHVAR